MLGHFCYQSGLEFCKPDDNLKALHKFNNYLNNKEY